MVHGSPKHLEKYLEQATKAKQLEEAQLRPAGVAEPTQTARKN